MAARDELGPCLVTGGGGFVGGALVRRLREHGYRVTSLARGHYTDLDAIGVRQVAADLSVAGVDELAQALAGHETVFHVAALAGVWGPRAAYWRTNAEGTKCLLEAARRAGVRRFVFTSSPSVVFDGRDHVDAGGELAYPERHLAHYPASKAEAERAVLAANGATTATGTLLTVALRPHLVFGPGDPHLVPRIVERAAAGRLAIVGDGHNRVSLTYVDNAAHAHLCAARSLVRGSSAAGRAYFVNQRESVALWPWIFSILDALGIARPRRRVSARTAYALGAACEAAWAALRLRGEPPMTRFVARQLATTHTYDVAPARRDLGYEERVDLAEATRRTIASLR